jgi:fumarate hydratase class II
VRAARRLCGVADPRERTLPLKAAALKLGFVTEELFDRVVDPTMMVKAYVAGK